MASLSDLRTRQQSHGHTAVLVAQIFADLPIASLSARHLTDLAGLLLREADRKLAAAREAQAD